MAAKYIMHTRIFLISLNYMSWARKIALSNSCLNIFLENCHKYVKYLHTYFFFHFFSPRFYIQHSVCICDRSALKVGLRHQCDEAKKVFTNFYLIFMIYEISFLENALYMVIFPVKLLRHELNANVLQVSFLSYLKSVTELICYQLWLHGRVCFLFVKRFGFYLHLIFVLETKNHQCFKWTTVIE